MKAGWTRKIDSLYTRFALHSIHFTLDSLYTRFTLHSIHFTLDSLYTRFTLHSIRFTLDSLYTRFALHSIRFTLDSLYTRFTLHSIRFTLDSLYTRHKCFLTTRVYRSAISHHLAVGILCNPPSIKETFGAHCLHPPLESFKNMIYFGPPFLQVTNL